MTGLTKNADGTFQINCPKPWHPVQAMPESLVKKVAAFAYKMSFTKFGRHRKYRSGGVLERRNGEIYANTFQGKLAEYSVWLLLGQSGFSSAEPNLETWDLGKWDSYDLDIAGRKICIKSTKHFGNLMLLETRDWDAAGAYLPNIALDYGGQYDFFILVRIKPNCEDLLKRQRLLYADDVDEEQLERITCSEKWEYDVPGYITRAELVRAIEEAHILPQGAILNGQTKMDAENYYVQACDFHDVEGLKDRL